MSRLQVVFLASCLVALLAVVPNADSGKKPAATEKIKATVAFVLPKDDKIVVMYREGGSDVYRHIKPMEDKVRLVIDGKEAKIEDFKVKDRVEFDFARKINTVIELRRVDGTIKKTEGK